jgi:ankyrin repeat protein
VQPIVWPAVWLLAQRGDAAGVDAHLQQEADDVTDAGGQFWNVAPHNRTMQMAAHNKALEIAARNDHAGAVAVLLRWRARRSGIATRLNAGVLLGVLHLASRHNSCRAAALLVRAGASVNQVQLRSMPGCAEVMGNVVSVAAQMGHVHMLAFAAAVGGVLHTPIENWDGVQRCTTFSTPMQTAARYGRVDVIEYLLGVKVSADGRDVDTCRADTPLLVAARFGRTAAVGALLAAKASVNHHGRDYNTALRWACALPGRRAIVDQLLEAGAVADACALLYAINCGDAAAVKQLLRARVCPDMEAVRQAVNASIGSTAVVLLLAKVTLQQPTWVGVDAQVASRGNSALELAGHMGAPSVVTVLLRAKAQVETDTFLGRETAWLAAMHRTALHPASKGQVR